MKHANKTNPAKPRCGLCGKTKNLAKTDCCGNWICNDEQKYVLFSYARNSCSRNHRRYMLCAYHHGEGHNGKWQHCKKCRSDFEPEMVVWYGTNEYNFEVLENPPHYEPTLCDRCRVVIKLGTDGYSIGPKGTLCERCNYEEHYQPPAKPRRPSAPRKRKVQLPANADANAIEIILSAQVRKKWRVEPTVRATEPPAHWLGQWRLDFGQKPDRTRVALVTNMVTLYTFVFPVNELGKRDNFERLFRLRLGFALVDAPSLVPWKDAPIVFAVGNPRRVVGSMNNMRMDLAWRTETPEFGPMEEDEDWINKTPFLSLPEFFPGKAFAKRLAEANPLNVKSP